MKRITLISILLALLLVIPALATEATTYTWDSVTFELTSVTEDLDDWGSQ